MATTKLSIQELLEDYVQTHLNLLASNLRFEGIDPANIPESLRIEIQVTLSSGTRITVPAVQKDVFVVMRANERTFEETQKESQIQELKLDAQSWKGVAEEEAKCRSFFQAEKLAWQAEAVLCYGKLHASCTALTQVKNTLKSAKAQINHMMSEMKTRTDSVVSMAEKL